MRPAPCRALRDCEALEHDADRHRDELRRRAPATNAERGIVDLVHPGFNKDARAGETELHTAAIVVPDFSRALGSLQLRVVVSNTADRRTA